MERLDTFLLETYVAAPGMRLNVKTIHDDFKAWVISKHGVEEWNAYGTYDIYRKLRSYKRYGHKRFKEGVCLTGLKYRDQVLAPRPPPISLRLNIIESPIPLSTSVTLPAPILPPIFASPPRPPPETPAKATPTSPAKATPTSPVEVNPTPAARPVSSFQPKKVDRRHRPAPPKKKEPEIYVPGSAIMPDLDVFIRPHLYRGVAPDKLPRSGVGGKPLEPLP
jgi:hypothetical protein